MTTTLTPAGHPVIPVLAPVRLRQQGPLTIVEPVSPTAVLTEEQVRATLAAVRSGA